jgi:SNF2 family DNA or RNA helicase
LEFSIPQCSSDSKNSTPSPEITPASAIPAALSDTDPSVSSESQPLESQQSQQPLEELPPHASTSGDKEEEQVKGVHGDGTKAVPYMVDEDDEVINLSGDEESPLERQAGEEVDEELEYGTAFEKVEEYDHYIGTIEKPVSNPWHPDLKKKLFPSQIIGFRWMADRHAKGGGIVGDKVGCGKVCDLLNALTCRHIKPLIFFSGSEIRWLNRLPPMDRPSRLAIFVFWWCSMPPSS